MSDHQFKFGMYLPELGLPFDQALATAKDIGADYVWFNRLDEASPSIRDLSDAEIDRMGERVAEHGLEIFLLGAGNPFKELHLADLDLDTMTEHPAFHQEFDDMVRSMQIAARLGIGAVNIFTFAWPGEYTAGKPTWPMRWLTRGGYIADVDMEKLVKALSLALDEAERYDVDLVLSMMSWNYTNTTGNFRRLADALGSKRLKAMWGPADTLNCGEWDTATAGFHNIRPYLYGLHIKDTHIEDGLQLKFSWQPLGEGDVDFITILRNLREHSSDITLSVATHFVPPSGSREEAMRINFNNLKRLVQESADLDSSS
ncbi:MAG: sugar phosphate isomerase/epimerase family protein [Chloroflexota bacterium]